MLAKIKILLIVFAVSQTCQGALLDDAKELLVKLREFAEGSANSGILRLYAHASEVSELRDTLQTVSRAQVDAEFAILAPQLVAIKDFAAENNIDITACLEGREDVFNGLPQDANDHVTACVVVSGEWARRTRLNAQHNLEYIVHEVFLLEEELARCGAEDDMCIAGIIGRIPPMEAAIPGSVAEIIRESDIEFDANELEVEACAVEQVSKVLADGHRIIDEIDECAHQINQ